MIDIEPPPGQRPLMQVAGRRPLLERIWTVKNPGSFLEPPSVDFVDATGPRPLPLAPGVTPFAVSAQRLMDNGPVRQMLRQTLAEGPLRKMLSRRR